MYGVPYKTFTMYFKHFILFLIEFYGAFWALIGRLFGTTDLEQLKIVSRCLFKFNSRILTIMNRAETSNSV